MSRNQLANQTPDITAEACSWIAQLETGDLTPADVEAFREWMQRSPRHTAEVRRLARLSAELNILNGLEPALRDAAEHYRPITRGRPEGTGFRALFVPQRLGTFAAATGVLLLVMAVLLRGMFLPQFPTELETPIGGYLEQTLADGSVVKLNTDSRIDIAYNDKQRHIFLRRGEVFFQVAHNPERPFVVHANGKTIRAVGTAFAVRLDRTWKEGTDLEVTVTEGRVELRAQPPSVTKEASEHMTPDGAPPKTATSGEDQPPDTRAQKEPPLVQTILDAGQHLVLSAREPAPKIKTVTEEEIRRSLSWREGLFDFSETPLDQVVREFDRHTRLNIEIADPALRDRKFSGIFPTGNIDTLLETLETAYGIEVTYVDANTVQLGRPPQG